MTRPFPDHIEQAAKEYFWILSKGYPQGPALKLVGDKFMLSRDMRQVLYRGVVPDAQAKLRCEKIGTVGEGDLVLDRWLVQRLGLPSPVDHYDQV